MQKKKVRGGGQGESIQRIEVIVKMHKKVWGVQWGVSKGGGGQEVNKELKLL